MKKIVVLGDCQSDGNNCLAHEILNDESAITTWSLRYHEKFPEALKWMMNRRKQQGQTFPEKTKISELQHATWKYLRDEEMSVAWPAQITNYDVTNFSIKGAHFYGHHRRMVDWMKNNPAPDLVLITDYTFNHAVVSFNHQGHTHVIEKRLDYNDSHWNPSSYDAEIHKKILSRLELQKSKSRDWVERRHRISYYCLTRFLKHHNIPFLQIRFGETVPEDVVSFDKIMGQHCDIDCQDMFESYRVPGKRGEYSRLKLDLQPVIALRVQQKIDEYFRQ